MEPGWRDARSKQTESIRTNMRGSASKQTKTRFNTTTSRFKTNKEILQNKQGNASKQTMKRLKTRISDKLLLGNGRESRSSEVPASHNLGRNKSPTIKQQ